MSTSPPTVPTRPGPAPAAPTLGDRLAATAAVPQHRNASFLLLNGVVGAAAGLLFWLLVVRVAHVGPVELGVGFATVSLGTTLALVAKGGLDVALLRAVPHADAAERPRLLRFALLCGGACCLLLATATAAVVRLAHGLPEIGDVSWLLAAAIALLLVVTWLQDAYALALGDARLSLRRNLVLNAARLLLPVPIAWLALGVTVPLAWLAALAASALAAASWFRPTSRLAPRVLPAVPRPVPAGPPPPPSRRAFLRVALHNVSSSAAEFLPGLLLTPIVLALAGPAAAAAFGLAWTTASLLLLASAAIGRSALAEMVRQGPDAHPAILRLALLQHLWLVLPGAVLGTLLAPFALSLFGPAYAAGALPLAVLCLSLVAVAPGYLYLNLLRARGHPGPLALFPAAIVVTLLALAPLLGARFGLAGVAWAWFAANVPFGAFGAWRIRQALHPAPPAQGVTLAQPLGGGPHLE